MLNIQVLSKNKFANFINLVEFNRLKLNFSDVVIETF